MNKIHSISFGLSLMFLFLLSGCAPLQEGSERAIPKVSVDTNHIYTIKTDHLGYITNKGYLELQEMKQNGLIGNYFFLYEAFKRAAEETLIQKKTHFAVLNNGINNLEGSPITSFKDYMDFCVYYKDKESNFYHSKYECISGFDHDLRIVMFDGPSGTIPLWDAKQVLAELK